MNNGNQENNQANAHIAALAEAVNKNQWKTVWIVLFGIGLAINSLCNVYLLFFKKECECSSPIAESSTLETISQTTFYPTYESYNISSHVPSQISTTIPISAKTITNQPTNLPTALPSELPTSLPSGLPTETPSATPTIVPTKLPSELPSELPTRLPSVGPSNIPTVTPTDQPSAQPTYSDISIGDFKISFQNDDHGYWIKCEGQYISNNDYPLLFDVIGYTYGYDSGDSTQFQLPDVGDRVLGIAGGSTYSVGDSDGAQTVTLSESNIPSHYHFMIADQTSCANNGDCCLGQVSGFESTNVYLSHYCNFGYYVNYEFRGTSSEPDVGRTSTIGSGNAFSIVQPTAFIGNLFIYAGQ